jgi:hypothetical protein
MTLNSKRMPVALVLLRKLSGRRPTLIFMFSDLDYSHIKGRASHKIVSDGRFSPGAFRTEANITFSQPGAFSAT